MKTMKTATAAETATVKILSVKEVVVNVYNDYYQPSEYFKGIRTLKQSVNTQDLQNLGNNMNSAASEIKRVSPEIDAEIEVTLERIKAVYNVLKAYIAQYEEIDDKLRNLFKQMNSIYDSGHLSDIM